jgi:hypothetical protein
MPHRAARAATLPNVNAFNVRARPVALAKYRRKLLGGVALGLGAVAAVAAMGGAATIAAAWLLSSSLSSNSNLRPAGVVVLEAAELPRPHRTLTETASLVGAPHSMYEAPETAVAELAPAEAPARTALAAPVAIPLPTPQPTPRQAPPKRVAEQTNEIPLPPARPLVAAPVAPPTPAHQIPAQQTPAQQTPARQEIARAPMVPPKPAEPQAPAEPAAAPAPAPAPATASITDFLKRLTPRLAYNNPDVRTPDTHTAVYDIEAHTVFMPSGEKLEAHSGLGSRMDDPRYVNERARGATPPNVYDLTLREEIFHGVRAIRLTPVADSKMYGRDGILAHTYMLGSSGQSFGCVSFRDYEKFLQAYLHGEVNRIVVVPHYDSSTVAAATRREGDKPYAFANP